MPVKQSRQNIQYRFENWVSAEMWLVFFWFFSRFVGESLSEFKWKVTLVMKAIRLGFDDFDFSFTPSSFSVWMG
jgi:hypothetical protein